MYIESIFCKDMGPISQAVIKPEFDSNGNPKPIVLVGTNGTGKSILLSSIVDSFYELGKETRFQDITIPMERGNGHQYYKLAAHTQIRIGASDMIAHIRYFDNQRNHHPEYLYHAGDWKVNEPSIINLIKSFGISIEHSFDKKHPKSVKCNSDLISDAFRDEVFCFFPADRTYVPNWMGEAYSRESRDSSLGHINIEPHFTNYLRKPMSVERPFSSIASWITDVLADAKGELSFTRTGIQLTSDASLIHALTISKANIETVLSAILQQQAELHLGLRNSGSARVSILSSANRKTIIPTLDALSQGQAVLLNMFLTIVQYADSTNVNKSIQLTDISGVVIIDEIDAHLHSDLQRSVLPKLIKLFPKVQFVVSTHSPLFVLGMQAEFGDDGFSLLEMPSASHISAEDFSEFKNAYNFMSLTNYYKAAIKESIEKALVISGNNKKLLVITEGPSDWKLMKGAWEHIKQDFKDIDGAFEFLEYEPQSKGNAVVDPYHQNMGGDALLSMCKDCSKLPVTQPLLFIADSDKDNVKVELQGTNGRIKRWGNNRIFSFVLPTPPMRGKNAPVCIEHYLSNSDLTTEFTVNGTTRRLYLSSEFDKRKHCLKQNHFIICENPKLCGGNELTPRIIEGDVGCAVLNVEDETDTNLALSKHLFARKVLEQAPETNKFDFSNFMLIFETIRNVLNELDSSPPTI